MLAGLGRVSIFTGQILSWIVTSLPRRRVLVPQMFEVGVRSVPVVMATGSFVGMVLAVQMYQQLHKLNADSAAGPIINIAIVKQLGPVLAAVIIAGRVGGAMAAELGTMRVTEQVDALRVMGADPVRYLVVPRFLACLVLVPMLTVVGDAVGALGGYLISVKALGITSGYYIQQTRNIMENWDIFVGLAKSAAFGALIGIICCYKGFHAKGGAAGVGRATTVAFVASFIAILVVNFFLEVLFRFLYNFYFE
jgi:phospholipid/cholesterol/gamma-HCH transport system permease protein